ncbi:hypothetical protein [Roseomonas sp. 18066]|uniref:hypothetical protein n=1 Tax=Roseomonas sp. 18066 TaxID=2681412 RepID=UPI0013589216|nr:hypothetical protein [Roseomonas sp. 18066]
MTRDPGPPLQALLAAPGTPGRMRGLADRLILLAGGVETAPRRGEVEAALALPYWGLRVLAMRVLAAWGGPRRKAWLVARADRAMPGHAALKKTRRGDPLRWAALETETARRLLAPMVDRSDATWLVERYLSDWRAGAWLLPLLIRALPHLDPGRLSAAMARDTERESLLWLVFHLRQLPERGVWLRRLAAFPDEALAKMARRALAVPASPPPPAG